MPSNSRTSLPAGVLEALNLLGASGIPGVPPALERHPIGGREIPFSPEPWNTLAKSLPEAELRDLIRGVVLLSRGLQEGSSRSKGIGGSVSPVIYLFRVYAQRFPEFEDELSTWVVQNRVNDYEPFGTKVHWGARTRKELEQIQAERERNQCEKQASDIALSRQRKAARAGELLPNAVRRGDLKAVHALVEKGARCETRSLQDLATENGRLDVVEYLRAKGIS